MSHCLTWHACPVLPAHIWPWKDSLPLNTTSSLLITSALVRTFNSKFKSDPDLLYAFVCQKGSDRSWGDKDLRKEIMSLGVSQTRHQRPQLLTQSIECPFPLVRMPQSRLPFLKSLKLQDEMKCLPPRLWVCLLSFILSQPRTLIQPAIVLSSASWSGCIVRNVWEQGLSFCRINAQSVFVHFILFIFYFMFLGFVSSVYSMVTHREPLFQPFCYATTPYRRLPLRRPASSHLQRLNFNKVKWNETSTLQLT